MGATVRQAPDWRYAPLRMGAPPLQRRLRPRQTPNTPGTLRLSWEEQQDNGQCQYERYLQERGCQSIRVMVEDFKGRWRFKKNIYY